MSDWFETRFKEPVGPGEPDAAFIARMRALVVEEWDAEGDQHHQDDHEGDIIMLDTEERRAERAGTPPDSRRGGRWLLAAAAVTAVGLIAAVAVASDDGTDVVDTADDPTASTTTTAALPAAPTEPTDLLTYGKLMLEPGAYVIDPDGDDSTPLRVLFDVTEEGWEPAFGAVQSNPDGYTGVFITAIDNLAVDGCIDHSPRVPAVGPTAADLASALTSLPPFDVVAAPSDVTAFGYTGKHLKLRVPEMTMDESAANYHDFADCVEGELHSWFAKNNDGPFYGYDGPGVTEEMWILDTPGTRVVIIKADNPGSPPADIATRDAIFSSIRIEP